MSNTTPTSATPAQILVDLDREVTAALPKGLAARIGVLGLPCSELEAFQNLDRKNWAYASKARDVRVTRLAAWASAAGVEDPIAYERDVLFPGARGEANYEAYAVRQRLLLALRRIEYDRSLSDLLESRASFIRKFEAVLGASGVAGGVVDSQRLDAKLSTSIEALTGIFAIGPLTSSWGSRLLAALPKNKDANRLNAHNLWRLRRALSSYEGPAAKPLSERQSFKGIFPSHLSRLDAKFAQSEARLRQALGPAVGGLLQRIENNYGLSGDEARDVIVTVRRLATVQGLSELTGIPCQVEPLENQIRDFYKVSEASADVTRLGFVSSAIRYRAAEVRRYALRFPDETVTAETGTTEWVVAYDDTIAARAEELEASTVPFSQALDAVLSPPNVISR